jgi:predicted DNA-binding transcriptional regulator AlpA
MEPPAQDVSDDGAACTDTRSTADTSQSITLTLPAAARLLGISETLGRELARRGQFPGAFRIGRAWRVHRATFEEQVAQMARGQPLEPDPDRILVRAREEARFRANRSGVH